MTTHTTALHTIKLSISACALGLLFLFAQSASAALGPPAPGGLRLAENAALFTVSFEMGSEKGDLLVPFGALRSTSDELDNDHTHYYIEDNTGDIVMDGITSGLLLSGDATFDDGRYRVPEGEIARFVLLVVFVTDEEDPSFQLRMRTLPFEIEGYLKNQQYNRHELDTFKSGTTPLNED